MCGAHQFQLVGVFLCSVLIAQLIIDAFMPIVKANRKSLIFQNV
jgi:hypothetical protein